MIDRSHAFPIKGQTKMLGLSRSTGYYKPRPISEALKLMRRLDELHLNHPFAAIVDVASHRVLSHRVSIAMEAAFCVEALKEPLATRGKPEIFNTDQGSQFTSLDFTSVLLDAKVSISMDGKGAWRDNVFVERL